MSKHVDRILLSIVILLVGLGFFIFTSASLGLLARNGASYGSVASSQIIFGIFGGGLALTILSQIHYRNWRQYAFYIFLFCLGLTLLVFTPLGFSYGGAQRWLDLGPFSLQPAEVLKIGFVIYLATWLSGMQKKLATFTTGALPYFSIVAFVGLVMLLQPDTDTFLIMASAATAMYIAAGGRWRDVVLVTLLAVLLIVVLAFTRPYIKDRITTFLNPESDPLGSSYQVQQSLIAVGAGGWFGRGYGQSIQKFEYLPEPIGDSIFAVYAEEFGFVGSSLLVLLFAAFTFRGYRIATHAKDIFGMLLVVGLVTIIVVQAFLNIAAMVALAPLGGLPLPFISHGGTALLVTLASIGIILNVSKYQLRRLR